MLRFRNLYVYSNINLSFSNKKEILNLAVLYITPNSIINDETFFLIFRGSILIARSTSKNEHLRNEEISLSIIIHRYVDALMLVTL